MRHLLCLVSGRKNNARPHYTSISGGGENIATASWAAVSGGQGSTGSYDGRAGNLFEDY